MPHHGFPTRLLDWSDSPLVAAFFATDEDQYLDKSGVIYALDPRVLNQTQGIVHIPTPPDIYLGELLKAAFDHWAASSLRNLACSPSEIDPRMMVQSSQFTAHRLTDPLEKMPNADQFLTYFEIPAEAKRPLRRELFMLGVRRAVLFPDRDNLAKAIVREAESWAEGEPEKSAGTSAD
jgi:hypothetical protein